MLRVAAILLLTSCTVSAVPAYAQTPARGQSILETIEWTWAAKPEQIDPALPNVLLAGDSITRAYYPEVVKMLSGRANVYLFATSAASGDPRLVLQMQDYFRMMPIAFAVIHFNNGMHGWGYSEAEYSKALPGLVDAMRAGSPKAALVWATTTPVRTADKMGANNTRIDERNAGSLLLMRQRHIPVDDQHALMAAHDDLHSDSVHYTAAGSALQAQQVEQSILTALKP